MKASLGVSIGLATLVAVSPGCDRNHKGLAVRSQSAAAMLISPPSGSVIDDQSVVVRVTVTDPSGVGAVTVNGVPATGPDAFN